MLSIKKVLILFAELVATVMLQSDQGLTIVFSLPKPVKIITIFPEMSEAKFCIMKA